MISLIRVKEMLSHNIWKVWTNLETLLINVSFLFANTLISWKILSGSLVRSESWLEGKLGVDLWGAHQAGRARTLADPSHISTWYVIPHTPWRQSRLQMSATYKHHPPIHRQLLDKTLCTVKQPLHGPATVSQSDTHMLTHKKQLVFLFSAIFPWMALINK